MTAKKRVSKIDHVAHRLQIKAIKNTQHQTLRTTTTESMHQHQLGHKQTHGDAGKFYLLRNAGMSPVNGPKTDQEQTEKLQSRQHTLQEEKQKNGKERTT